MKNKMLNLCLLCLSLLLCNISANANSIDKQIVGKWISAQKCSKEVNKVVINKKNGNFYVNLVGNCKKAPTCKWGKQPLKKISGNQFKAVYATPDASKDVFVTLGSNGKMHVKYIAYDECGFETGKYSCHFKKQPKPTPPPIVCEIPVKEDCTSFNPYRTRVRCIKGNWVIVDGSRTIYNFGKSKKDAYDAWRIIKKYRITQTCYVGRPDPSFEYCLSRGNAFGGTYSAESCTAFNVNNIRVEQARGEYCIMDGRKGLFFFPSKAEAEQAYHIIKKHQFTSTCAVGKGDFAMTYFKK